MAGYVQTPHGHHYSRQAPDSSALEESPLARRVLISLALAFIFLFLVIPLLAVFTEAFRKGYGVYLASIHDPDALDAILLTLKVVAISVPLNTLFGLSAAWAITKFDFRWKNLLITLIDLPFAVSPVIAGLAFVLLFSTQHGFWVPLLRNSPPQLLALLPKIGPGLAQTLLAHQSAWTEAGFGWLYAGWDVQVIFALPGIILATCFVTFPFVAREIIPLMQSQGSNEEQAALTLGASGWKTFWHVTLPNIKWALLHGIILCNARAMGEFGAVSVVSGHIRGLTNTIPLHIEILYNEYQFSAAFAVASLLTLLALLTLVLKTAVEWKSHDTSTEPT